MAGKPEIQAPATSVTWLSRGRERAAIGLLLLSTLALAAGSAAQKSVTVDEYQALPHGLAIWRTGDLHLATGVPLLPSALPALPLLLTDARLDVSSMPDYTSSWQCGLSFLVENAFDRDPQSGQYVPSGRYHDYFLLGRLTSILALLVTCGLAHGYARCVYGRAAGLVALVIACFSPNLLAHGRLVTPDIYLSGAMVASLWMFDRMVRKASWWSAAGLGMCLGLAALCKLTGLLLFVLLPICWWIVQRPEQGETRPRSKPSIRSWRLMAMALAGGVLVINAGYLFDGTLTPLGRFVFESRTLQRLAALAPAWLTVPLPRYFCQGIDAQLAESGYAAYLLGDFNNTGFFSYYLVALLVKTPAPVLLLCALAWVCGGRPTRRELPLLVVSISLILFFSISRHKNIGLRYVLFLEPLMAVWIGRLAGERLTPPRWLLRVLVGAMALLAAISLSTWPHYLPYFNWLSGGPDNGHRWLLDSNLDWGQDLIALRRYLDDEGIDQIDLAYFGRVPPEVYGIRYRTLRAGEAPRHRHVAISANLLWGLMYIVNGDLNYWPDAPDGYAAFRAHRPKAILGHSIYVFDLGQ